MAETVLLDVKDRVATVTLNRPERLNAWNAQMASELNEAMIACNDDDEVRVVVLTGAGRAFCAGADLGGGGRTFGGRPASGTRPDRPSPERQLYPYEMDKVVITGPTAGSDPEQARKAMALLDEQVVPHFAATR